MEREGGNEEGREGRVSVSVCEEREREKLKMHSTKFTFSFMIYSLTEVNE